jgi:hypothetical protein
MCFLVVGGDRQDLDVGACLRENGRDHRAVRLVDLAGCQRLTGGTELASGGEHAHARLHRAHDVDDARSREGADLRGSETGARLDHRVSFTDVTTTKTDMLAG